MKIIRKIMNIPKNVSIFLIELYQKYISKITSLNKCIFYPTCSEYSKKAIKKYGFFIGGLKGLIRIIRCNPHSKGGIDHLK